MIEGETVSLTEKGANGVNNANTLRNANIHVDAGDVVHTKCRQTFINKKDIATNRSFDEDNVPKRKLRRETIFDNKSDCFLCATTVLNDKNHRQEFYTVKTKEMSETMKKYCDQRVDKWATEVRGRM